MDTKQASRVEESVAQDLHQILLSLKSLPPDVRLKLQYIIEGAKLVSAEDAGKHGGAA